MPVEAGRGNAAEVTDPGQAHREQLVDKLVHASGAHRHLDPDGQAGAELEVRDRLARLQHHRLLAGRLVALVANEHHVRVAQRRLEVDDAALHHLGAALLGIGALVSLQEVDALDHDLALAGHGAHHHASLATVLSGHDLHGVVFMNVEMKPAHDAYKTYGARETISMKFLSRSSRATGPKMRVPRGLFWGPRMTAAFSSKRIVEPSRRRNSREVRTPAALTTSLFLT